MTPRQRRGPASTTGTGPPNAEVAAAKQGSFAYDSTGGRPAATSPCHAAARAYARRGWTVLPIAPNGKRPQLPVELSPVQRTARLLQLPPQPGTGPLPGLARVVAEAPTGTRNNRLNWAAYRARKHAAAGKLDLKQARAALLDAALKVGLPEREALATIASGMRSAGAA